LLADTSGEGVQIAPDNIQVLADGSPCLYLNRLSSDGDIVDFRKDGSVVGSIGTVAGSPYLSGQYGGGIRVAAANVLPCNTAGAYTDGAGDLGASGQRWKDFYLSGGVYVGGTGSANKLDDYEEGVYQYTITGATSGSMTPRSGYEYFAYTKIGRQVTVIGRFETSGSHDASGYLKWSLPFAVGNFADLSEAAGGTLFVFRTGLADVYNPTLVSSAGVSYFLTYYNTISNNEVNTLDGGNVDSSIEGHVHFTYFTD